MRGTRERARIQDLPRFCEGVGVSSVSEPGPTVPASVRDIHVGHRTLDDGGAPAFVDMGVDDSDQERPARLTGNRFEVLSDRAELRERRPRKRLVLISQNRGGDHEWDRDTKSIAGASEVDFQDCHVESALDQPSRNKTESMVSNTLSPFSDTVNPAEVFDQRTRVMQFVPWVIRGAFRAAIKVALQEILAGTKANSELRAARGWKLLLLLPRMILFRPPGGNVSRKRLESRIVAFHEGRWMELLRDSTIAAELCICAVTLIASQMFGLKSRHADFVGSQTAGHEVRRLRVRGDHSATIGPSRALCAHMGKEGWLWALVDRSTMVESFIIS